MLVPLKGVTYSFSQSAAGRREVSLMKGGERGTPQADTNQPHDSEQLHTQTQAIHMRHVMG